MATTTPTTGSAATLEELQDAMKSALQEAAGRGKMPAQVDDKGNSIITGKPPVTASELYEAERVAGEARRAAQPQPNFDADPLWGFQVEQVPTAPAATQKTAPVIPNPDVVDPAITIEADPITGRIPNPIRDIWSGDYLCDAGSALNARSKNSATEAALKWNSLVLAWKTRP